MLRDILDTVGYTFLMIAVVFISTYGVTAAYYVIRNTLRGK